MDDPADRFEHKHVHSVYDEIATEFSKTRYNVWPSVKTFLDNIACDNTETSVIEVGCGNGKNLLYLKKRNFSGRLTGCDFAEKFVEMVNLLGIECVKANAVLLPFQNETFDYTLSVAVIHHLSTEDRRVTAIGELIRITKKNGLIFIQVWAFEQHSGSKREFVTQDTMVSWKNDHQRYYHIFVKDELETLIETKFNGIVSIEDRKYDYGNWLVILKKL